MPKVPVWLPSAELPMHVSMELVYTHAATKVNTIMCTCSCVAFSDLLKKLIFSEHHT